MKIRVNRKHPNIGDVYSFKGLVGRFIITGICDDNMLIETYPDQGSGYGSKSLERHMQHIREGRIIHYNI